MDVYPEEAALANCLRSGKKVATPAEKSILDLSKNNQVLFTPHNAFNTQEAVEQKASLSADAVVSYFKKGAFPCPVPSE